MRGLTQQQLGRKSVESTEIYQRALTGEKVIPTKNSTKLWNVGSFAERNAIAEVAGTHM